MTGHNDSHADASSLLISLRELKEAFRSAYEEAPGLSPGMCTDYLHGRCDKAGQIVFDAIRQRRLPLPFELPESLQHEPKVLAPPIPEDPNGDQADEQVSAYDYWWLAFLGWLPNDPKTAKMSRLHFPAAVFQVFKPGVELEWLWNRIPLSPDQAKEICPSVYRESEEAIAYLIAAIDTPEQVHSGTKDSLRTGTSELGGTLLADNPPSQEEHREQAEEYAFRKEGDYWTIAYEGKPFRLKNIQGLHYIAHLLKNPGREFHVLGLVASVERTGHVGVGTSELSMMSGEELGERGLTVSKLDNNEPVLDEEAKAQYKDKLEELQEELAKAEKNNDPGAKEKAQHKTAAIEQAVAEAYGIGGRDRKTASLGEKARVNVTKLIRTALENIGTHRESLFLHLNNCIKTGRYCSYQPDLSHPISWGL
jgi:hypothetical protein